MPAEPADDAFSAHVLPELEILGRVALSLTRRPADAEDLVQETLLRAWRAIDRFDGRHPRAWLLTIMRNANLNSVRRRRPELLRDPDAGTTVLEATNPGRSAESELLDTHLDADLEQAVAGLPNHYRLALELVDVDGLTYAEAAEVLNIPAGTVMSRLHRARRRVRGSLGDPRTDVDHRSSR